jgi:hypothetical protein
MSSHVHQAPLNQWINTAPTLESTSSSVIASTTTTGIALESRAPPRRQCSAASRTPCRHSQRPPCARDEGPPLLATTRASFSSCDLFRDRLCCVVVVWYVFQHKLFCVFVVWYVVAVFKLGGVELGTLATSSAFLVLRPPLSIKLFLP